MIYYTRNDRVGIVLSQGDESCLTNVSKFVHERRRRAQIQSELYYAKLFIDGQLVGCTKSIRLGWPSLEIDFKKKFEVILDNYPENVCIKMYKRNTILNDSLISAIYINVPGGKLDFSRLIPLEFLSPSSDWYKFSQATKVRDAGNDDENRVNGCIFITSQWRRVGRLVNPMPNHDFQVIRPEPSICKQLIGLEQGRGEKSEKSEGEINVNDIVLTNMKPGVRAALNDASMRFTAKGTKHSFLNSNRFKEPIRHQLLKQRSYGQFSKSGDFPVPLQECDIGVEETKFVSDHRLRSRLEKVSTIAMFKFSVAIQISKVTNLFLPGLPTRI